MPIFTFYLNIIKTTLRIVVKECRCYDLYTLICSLMFENYFVKTKYIKSKNTAQRLINKHRFLGHYFIAKNYFVKGLYTDAINHLNIFLSKFDGHADASYLLSRSYFLLNEKTKAWIALEKLLSTSKRKRTWLELSSLVETKDNFFQFKKIWQENDSDIIKNCSDLVIRDYIAIGALRAAEYDFAINLWKDTLKIIDENQLIGNQKKHSIFSAKMAQKALSDLKLTLDSKGISFFLISGTLLGCIREGAILAHDKDIDIGVDSKINFTQIINLVSSCGFFFILPKRSENLIRIKHVNGISIDIFKHFQDGDDYWHGGVKSIWHNTKFDLTLHPFLGDKYLIPENYDLYLTENYGKNWQIPQIDFDSTIDTPNAEIINKYEMIAYCYKKIFEMYLYNKINKTMVENYLNYIKKIENKG